MRPITSLWCTIWPACHATKQPGARKSTTCRWASQNTPCQRSSRVAGAARRHLESGSFRACDTLICSSAPDRAALPGRTRRNDASGRNGNDRLSDHVRKTAADRLPLMHLMHCGHRHQSPRHWFKANESVHVRIHTGPRPRWWQPYWTGGYTFNAADRTHSRYSGILAGCLGFSGDTSWRVAFIGGLVLAPVVGDLVGYPVPSPAMPANGIIIVVAGLLVGFGTRLGGGCTSGHSVCGVARLSQRSIVATAVFMVTAIAVVALTRHVLGG